MRHSHQDLCVAKLLCACTQVAMERGADRRDVQRRVRARLRWVRALAGVQRQLQRRSHELRATLWRTMLGLQTASGQAAAMLLEVRHSTRATTHSASGWCPPTPAQCFTPPSLLSAGQFGSLVARRGALDGRPRRGGVRRAVPPPAARAPSGWCGPSPSSREPHRASPPRRQVCAVLCRRLHAERASVYRLAQCRQGARQGEHEAEALAALGMPRHQHMPGFDPHRVRLHGSGGRAGLLALCMTTNAPSRVADAYEHPSFNPVVDREGKYRTRAMVSVPIRSSRHAGGKWALVAKPPRRGEPAKAPPAASSCTHGRRAEG